MPAKTQRAGRTRANTVPCRSSQISSLRYSMCSAVSRPSLDFWTPTAGCHSWPDNPMSKEGKRAEWSPKKMMIRGGVAVTIAPASSGCVACASIGVTAIRRGTMACIIRMALAYHGVSQNLRRYYHQIVFRTRSRRPAKSHHMLDSPSPASP